MKNLANEYLKSTVELQSINLPSLSSALTKIKKPLTAFAAKRETTFGKLRIIDVCNDVDKRKLSHEVTQYFDSLPTEKKRYDAKSRLGFILRNIEWDGGEQPSDPDHNFVVPEFLSPLLAILPRYAGGTDKFNNGGAMIKDTESRLNLPITIRGHRMLSAILAVVEDHSINDIDTLFLEYRSQIYRKIEEIHPPNLHDTVTCLMTDLRKRLGYPSFAVSLISKAVPLCNFPKKLKEQVETFIRNAPYGFNSDPELRKRAKQKKITIKPLEESTIKLYLGTISRFLGKIEFEDYESIDIRSLLNITVQKIPDEEGEVYTHLFNPYIEQARKSEMTRDSDRREIGFDSSQFATFLTSIKSVATFNGIFHLHELFNKAYEIVSDDDSIKKRKEAKKRVFDRKWIDGEISRIGKQVRKIASEKSFIFEKYSTHSKATENLRLCLFYVELVMLRYMGYRQQCLRNCQIGHNIFFEKNDSIRFFWGIDEIKNDRELTATLHPEKHKRSHKVLIDALNLYFEDIYPFIEKYASRKINGQLIVRLGKRDFDVYDPESPSLFYRNFKSSSKKYIQFGDRLKEFSTGINPQFFRGLCSDWLLEVLHLDRDTAASFIGDTERTFSAEYVSNTIGYNANNALDKANKNLEIEQQAEAEAANRTESKKDITIKKLRIKLKEKDKIIMELTESSKILRMELARLKNAQSV